MAQASGNAASVEKVTERLADESDLETEAASDCDSKPAPPLPSDILAKMEAINKYVNRQR